MATGGLVMAAAAEGACVLIVDDNVELLELMAASLPRLSSFTVVTCEDGASALQRYYALDPRPVCVVIDVVMPEMNGYQLVRALRGDATSAQTPLIMLTAMVQDRDRFIGLASGADQYLNKPVTPAELVTAIQRALTISETERQQRMQQMIEEES